MDTNFPSDKLLTPEQVSEQLGMTKGALSQWRYLGKGPVFLKLTERAIRYRQSDIDAWLNAAVHSRTDQPAHIVAAS